MKKISLLLILVFMSLIIYSCEDDALLMPQIEAECVGSYCNLSLPNKNNDLFAFNPEMY